MLRLAYALDLPDNSLLGSDAGVPPDFKYAVRHPSLDVLAEPECWRLLDDHGVGRIAFAGGPDDPPHVLPLNYAVRDHTLVMRTRQGSLLDTTAATPPPAARPASRSITSTTPRPRAGASSCVARSSSPSGQTSRLT
jgi:hypothetical protein